MRSNFYFEESKAPHTGYKYGNDEDFGRGEIVTIKFTKLGMQTFYRYWVSWYRNERWNSEILPFLFHKDRYCTKGINVRKGMWK